MKFQIQTSNLIIGSTNLENSDLNMGMVHGLFIPETGYSSVQDVFQLFKQEKFEEYSEYRDKLKLVLVDENGTIIPTDCIHIEDYLSECNEATIEIKIIDVDAWDSRYVI